ncbi:MAG TPA: hypothetical protein VE954_43210 [Oligoflexus sp.]|uniref:hypothetical protein n=1 Tax=Oligoflexus sp. TaxID=1971216 RepID=UPI002D4C820A|nr:hypothetical protein [Oligoflexus sp.]HYX39954.1 hypothetical protein [Oligoflexus sp.]
MRISEAMEKLKAILEECGDINLVVVEHHEDHWAIVDQIDIDPIVLGPPKELVAGIVNLEIQFIGNPEPYLKLVKGEPDGNV